MLTWPQIGTFCQGVQEQACAGAGRSSKEPQAQYLGRHQLTRTIRLGLQDKETEQVQLYNIGSNRAKPAPTITVQISSSTGMKDVKVLPNSGADISAAGQEVMRHLGQHKNNYCLPESALEK